MSITAGGLGSDSTTLYVGRRCFNQDPIPGRWYCPKCKYYNLAANKMLSGFIICQQCGAMQPGQQLGDDDDTSNDGVSNNIIRGRSASYAGGNRSRTVSAHKKQPVLYSSSSEFPYDRWFCRPCGHYNLGVVFKVDNREACQKCHVPRSDPSTAYAQHVKPLKSALKDVLVKTVEEKLSDTSFGMTSNIALSSSNMGLGRTNTNSTNGSSGVHSYFASGAGSPTGYESVGYKPPSNPAFATLHNEL